MQVSIWGMGEGVLRGGQHKVGLLLLLLLLLLLY
jgi:hypothetical protein